MSVKFTIFSILTTLILVVVFRAVFLFKPERTPKSCSDSINHEKIILDQNRLNRFIGALNIQTISYGPGQYEISQLEKLAEFVKDNFPKLNNARFVTRELVSNYTIVYTLRGSDLSLRPYMLTSHQDVVPVVREKWSSNPFEAVLKEDGFIYARGTIDAKHLLMSMLEAIEYLIGTGFRPRRTIYFVFGHDEESSGQEGAAQVARILKDRLKLNNWDKLEYILDEGGIISSSRCPGIDRDIALVGVEEKGYLTLKLSTVGSVGHGSMPPPQTAITKLARVAGRFHSHLLPSYFGQGIEREMFDIFAAHSSWPLKLIYSNYWLFKPLLEYVFSSHPTLNSLVRSSTAVTVISGGTKENVLPDSASVIINHRVHPRQTVAQVVEFVRNVVDDPTVTIDIECESDPTPTSPYCADCSSWQLIKHTILQVYPKTLVIPSTLLATTDSRWYVNITDSIYKFSAIVVPLEEMNRFHGHDERISLKNYEGLINFYHHLILNSDERDLAIKPSQRDEL